MHNDIIKLLNIKDENIIISKIEIVGTNKNIYISKKLESVFCPLCNCRMHSKGIYTREVNHPILQDGFRLTLFVDQRKWKCTNKDCNHYQNDEFAFVEKFKQSTNLTPYMIIFEMKNLNASAAQVARRFNVSDTYVHYTFQRYIDLPRLPLPEYLSIDEVYLDFDNTNRYCLILMDFLTGDIVDILPNRNDKTTRKYFKSISKEERNNVKFLICDMYNPYINYTFKYFRNAVAIVDSFHVIKWILNKINQYINKVKKKYQERDEKELEELNKKTNKENKTKAVSNEVYLLNNHKWALLKNEEHIEYSLKRKLNRKLKMYMDTYDLEKAFLALDEKFPIIRKYKEKYITFNNTIFKDDEDIEAKLNILIKEYKASELQMFIEFADLLVKYKNEIIRSFVNGK